MVYEYEDVFPDELLGLPPHRGVDFVIELHPGTSPISMTPHRLVITTQKVLFYTLINTCFEHFLRSKLPN